MPRGAGDPGAAINLQGDLLETSLPKPGQQKQKRAQIPQANLTNTSGEHKRPSTRRMENVNDGDSPILDARMKLDR